jgi:predicted LPLAT superfamily acyltransferase
VSRGAAGWADEAERGAPATVRLALSLAVHGGRLARWALLWPVTLWFLLTSAGARGASREYLGRALGRPARVADVARHFHAFAQAVLDRVLILAGRDQDIDVRISGLDTVMARLAEGRGVILLGAHLGSFEVLRAVARHAPVPVWALMYRRNGGALTRLLDELAPCLRERVIEIGDTASMIRARECVERGEIVGVLADRAPPGHRMVRVPFLGQAASFPAGPFVLAATLGAPVVRFHAVRVGPGRYEARFSAFSDRVVLRREHRDADLRAVVGAYAAALERACRAHPLQWFNFFPFWQETPHGQAAAASRPARAAGLVPTGGG